jgi:hypothetical protein
MVSISYLFFFFLCVPSHHEAFELAIGNERFRMAFLVMDVCNYVEIDKEKISDFINYQHKFANRKSSYHKLVHMLRGQLVNHPDAKDSKCPTCIEMMNEPVRERDHE